jgi:hypothetical protein
VYGDLDIVTYDPARVSEQDVRRWIQLSPDVSPSNFYQVPEEIEFCISAMDPGYEPCGKSADEINAHNAQHTLDRIGRRIKDLDPAHYPPDLREVVLYLRQIQRFWLWKETQRFAFWKTGDLRALESQFEGINPTVICGPVLDRIAAAQTHDEAVKFAHYDWWNCVWDEERKRIGEYPKAAWEKFLANHGISERYVEQDVDD